MAGPINLDVLDPPIVEQTKFEPDMQRWLSNIVDIINASFMTLNNAFANLIFIGQAQVGGGGAGPITVTVTGLTSSEFVSATLLSSSNPVTILTVQAITNGFNITFSGDPGASALIAYQAFGVQP